MFFLTSMLAKAWFKPALIIIFIGILLLAFFSIQWSINNWKTTIYTEGYNAARIEIQTAQNEELRSLAEAVNILGKDSVARSEALEIQQVAFAKTTSNLLTQIKNKPLVTVNAAGDCKPTTEASKTWNALQKTLTP